MGCLVLLGCARSTVPTVTVPKGTTAEASLGATAGSTSDTVSAPPTISDTSASLLPVEWPELERLFAEEHVTGTIALYDTQDGVLGCSNLAKCAQSYLPASTFKIPHSMIALETGVVASVDTMLPWDKQKYQVVNWNQDLRFLDAFRYSCVPCYQAIARQVGETREQEWVKKLDYGNHDISGGVDKFWLWGGLRITPLQQVDFLRRFDSGQLPIAARTAEAVRELMALETTQEHVLRAKTGSAMPPQEAHQAGWFVGWLELAERRVFFALLIDSHAEGVDVRPLRRAITERVLAVKGMLPSAGAQWGSRLTDYYAELTTTAPRRRAAMEKLFAPQLVQFLSLAEASRDKAIASVQGFFSDKSFAAYRIKSGPSIRPSTTALQEITLVLEARWNQAMPADWIQRVPELAESSLFTERELAVRLQTNAEQRVVSYTEHAAPAPSFRVLEETSGYALPFGPCYDARPPLEGTPLEVGAILQSTGRSALITCGPASVAFEVLRGASRMWVLSGLYELVGNPNGGSSLGGVTYLEQLPRK